MGFGRLTVLWRHNNFLSQQKKGKKMNSEKKRNLHFLSTCYTCKYFVVAVQSLSHVWFFATPWTTAHQARLSFTISWSWLKFMSTEEVIQPLPLLSSWMFSSLQRETPYSWAVPPFLFPLNHETPLISFLSLWIYLFWILFINEVIQYVEFCVWLLQHSIMFSRHLVVACINTSFLFLAK